MSFEALIFYLFAAIALVAAAGVVGVRNPVHAALLLVLTFFTTAALWIMAGAEFLGITLVLVYVGAVMVLFLFVVMMLDINIAAMRAGFVRILPLGLIVFVILLGELIWVVSDMGAINGSGIPVEAAADYSNTKAIGSLLFTEYLYPFELAAMILLLAIVAAIVLTMRRRLETKTQRPSEQIAVRAKDRLRLLRLDARQD